MQSLFFTSHADRIALARQRYFEDGELPTGVVSDAVMQSWARCQRLRWSPRDKIEFQPVTLSRRHQALQKNASLRQAWQHEATTLLTALGETDCSAILTDATGVLIGATPWAEKGSIIFAAHREGVNLSEDLVGTSAPGIVAKTGMPVSVLGGEHFFDSVGAMYCAAAPIRDINGQIAGILDISREGTAFPFDPLTVVGLFATAIESRLLVAQSRQHLILRFQLTPGMLDTPLAGLIGVDIEGRIAWSNSNANQLLGGVRRHTGTRDMLVEEVFGHGFSQLASQHGKGCVRYQLCNGLQVFARCDLQLDDGLKNAMVSHSTMELPQEKPSQSTPMAEPAPAYKFETPDASDVAADTTLRDADADLILRTVGECQGNISAAARKLGVSRGLIYRRLKGGNDVTEMTHLSRPG